MMRGGSTSTASMRTKLTAGFVLVVAAIGGVGSFAFSALKGSCDELARMLGTLIVISEARGTLGTLRITPTNS